MEILAEKIKSELKEGYELQATDTHKASTYFYITNPDGIQLIARTSDHEAIAAGSRSHVQFICDTLMHLDFDFEEIYDEDDYEVELTKSEAADQLSDYFSVEITEDMVWEADEGTCNLDWEKMSADLIDTITAKYIAVEITKAEPTILF